MATETQNEAKRKQQQKQRRRTAKREGGGGVGRDESTAASSLSATAGAVAGRLIAKSVTAGVVLYGGYRFVKWLYDDNNDNGENEKEEQLPAAVSSSLEDDIMDLLFRNQSTPKRRGTTTTTEERSREEDHQQKRNSEEEAKSSPPEEKSDNNNSSPGFASRIMSSLSDKVLDCATSAVLYGASRMISPSPSSLSSTATMVTPDQQGISRGNQKKTQTKRFVAAAPPNAKTCRRRVRTAFVQCLPTIQRVIDKSTDTSDQTKRLKELRKLKKEKQQMKAAAAPHESQLYSQEEGGLDQEDEKKNDKDDNDPNESNVNDDLGKKKKDDDDHHEDEEDEAMEDLWLDILIETVTRSIASTYIYALLLLSFTVQIHYYSSLWQEGSEQVEEIEKEAEQMLLRSHRYVLNQGLPLLLTTVRKHVEDAVLPPLEEDDDDEDDAIPLGNESDEGAAALFCNWGIDPSRQLVTRRDVERALYETVPNLLDDVSGRSGKQQQHSPRRRQRRRRIPLRYQRNWVRFILPEDDDYYEDADKDEGCVGDGDNDGKNGKKTTKKSVQVVLSYDTIWDICQSPIFVDAQEQLLRTLRYEILRDGCKGINTTADGWGSLFDNDDDDDHHRSSSSNKKKQQQQQPLAVVMAKLKKSTTSLLFVKDGSSDDRTVEWLQKLPTVLELGDVSLYS